MATKGPSMRYGNTNGAHNRGKETKNINYAWAKDFNRGGLKQHFIEHAKEFDAKTIQEYAAKAIHFANEVDRKNYKSVVDHKGTTYKFDLRDGRMAEVTKDGYVITYRHTGGKFWYRSKKGEKTWIKI